MATFHTSNLRSRAMQAAYPLMRPSLEKISARIAVSEDARHTVTTHIGGDAVVIPNGVFVDRFADAPVRPEWQGTPERADRRLRRPAGRAAQGAAGAVRGHAGGARRASRHCASWSPAAATREEAAELLPAAPARARSSSSAWSSDEEKASLLRSVDVYVAPHTGGESFGIVLVEAMSAGAPVLASDLDAFRRVLDDGALGELFGTGDAATLAVVAARAAGRRAAAASRCSAAASRRRPPLRLVASSPEDVLAVYETVLGGGHVEARPAAGRPVVNLPTVLARPARAGPARLVPVRSRPAGWTACTTGSRGRSNALDAQLVRRAEAAIELATSGALDPASGLLLADAASRALEAGELTRSCTTTRRGPVLLGSASGRRRSRTCPGPCAPPWTATCRPRSRPTRGSVRWSTGSAPRATGCGSPGGSSTAR